MMETIVTMPPEVVRTLASSTVLVKASSLVNRDFAGIVANSVWQRYVLVDVAGMEEVALRGFTSSFASPRLAPRDTDERIQQVGPGKRKYYW